MSYNLYSDRYSKDSYLTEEILEFTSNINDNTLHLSLKPQWDTMSFRIESSGVSLPNWTQIGPDKLTTETLHVANIVSPFRRSVCLHACVFTTTEI